MKRVLLIALAAALTVGAAHRTAAQKVEFGVRAGVGSQSFSKLDSWMGAKSRLGWNLAAVSRIRLIGFGDGLLGAGLFFQPEVVYSQNNIKTTARGRIDLTPVIVTASKTRMQTVDIPLLLGLKVSIVRVQAGPVFNVMNKFTSAGGGAEILPLRAATGYALGASVDIGAITIDGRYHGELKEMSFKGDWADVKSRFSSWSLGLGIMF